MVAILATFAPLVAHPLGERRREAPRPRRFNRGKPTTCAVTDRTDREHHRHFDQNAHDRRQGRARLGTEEGDRRGHGEFEEVAGTDQRPGAATA